MGFFDRFRRRPPPPGGPIEGVIEAFSFGGDGVIALADGRRVVFDAADCDELVALTPGTEVLVDIDAAAADARATKVAPLPSDTIEQSVWPEIGEPLSLERRYGIDGQPHIVEVRRTLFDRDAALKRHPTWHASSEYEEHVLAPTDPTRWADLDVPPEPFLFEPWHEGIRASAARCVHLVGADGAEPIATLGGAHGPVASPWPNCPSGHGPMMSLLNIEPSAFRGLLDKPRRLSVLVCPTCLPNHRHLELGREGAPAFVEWQLGEDARSAPAETTTLPRVELTAELALSFAPSWLSRPRKDVTGHVPIDGIASRLFQTTVRLRRRDDAPFHYQDAGTVFDQHFRPYFGGVVLGGFSEESSLCSTCQGPRRQFFHLMDYLTGGELKALLQGSDQLTLLACDRTPACGGPERGLLRLTP